MSVIAFDGRYLAADSQGTCAGARLVATKLFRLGNGDILGFTGDRELGLRLKDLWWEGRMLSDWPDFQKGDDWCRLVIATKGKVFTTEKQPVLMPLESPYYAWGSGRDFALGAMAAGADAVRAVEAACTHSIECGGAVVSFPIAAP